MFVVVISKFRQRTWLILRVLIILLLLALLIPPLVYSLTTKDITSGWFKEQRPTGNPMRVDNHQHEFQKLKESPVDQFKETLRNYYNKN